MGISLVVIQRVSCHQSLQSIWKHFMSRLCHENADVCESHIVLISRSKWVLQRCPQCGWAPSTVAASNHNVLCCDKDVTCGRAHAFRTSRHINVYSMAPWHAWVLIFQELVVQNMMLNSRLKLAHHGCFKKGLGKRRAGHNAYTCVALSWGFHVWFVKAFLAAKACIRYGSTSCHAWVVKTQLFVNQHMDMITLSEWVLQ